MQKNTVQKLRSELERLKHNSDPKVIAFLQRMISQYPELAR
jgi:hypothetical protein